MQSPLDVFSYDDDCINNSMKLDCTAEISTKKPIAKMASTQSGRLRELIKRRKMVIFLWYSVCLALNIKQSSVPTVRSVDY